MPSSGERFLDLVDRLGVVSAAELKRIRREQRNRRLDGPALAQELLKRTELTPRQVADIQRALRESREVVIGASDETSAAALDTESTIDPDPPEAVEVTARAETTTVPKVDPASAELAADLDAVPDSEAETHELRSDRLDRIHFVESDEVDSSRAMTLELLRPRRMQEPEPGDVVGGRFRLVEQIGKGAQGLVYRAQDTSLERDVAIKFLRTDAPGQAKERFERESKLVSQLGHPGIVTVFEAGVTDRGLLYYAMELVEGSSLEEVIDAEAPLSALRSAKILESVALAIHHAHEVGLVHRDLKPGNVLLDVDEDPRVADFGLVALAEGTRLTQTRAVVGTPVYMAPEQAEGERIDRRADVYSLGAVLYECLVGRPPFEGVTPLEIFRKVVREDPIPPRVHRPDVPVLVEAVCLRALEKDPRARYPTAAAFARDLRRAVEGERLAPRRAAPVIRRRVGRTLQAHPIVIGFLVGAGVGAIGAWTARGRIVVRPTATQVAAPDPDVLDRRADSRKKLLLLAREERARGLEQAAVDWLRTLDGGPYLEHDPRAQRDAAQARALEALALQGLGQAGRARAVLAQAILLDDTQPLVALAQASLARASGDLSAARSTVDAVLRTSPLLVEAHLERAWVAYAQLEPREALEALDRAIELTEPRPWPVALQARCLILQEQGKTQHALWDMERLLEQLGQGRALGLSSVDVGKAGGTQRRLDSLVAAVDSRVHTAARSRLVRPKR